MIEGSQNKVQKGKFSFAVRLIALFAAATVSTGAKPAPEACYEEPDAPNSITKMSSNSKVRSFSTAPALSFELGKAVAQVQAEARANPTGRTNEPQQFTIAISGGSLPKLLAAGVLGDNVDASVASIDWQNWHVFFVDERFVPLDHADSNFKACQEQLFSKVPIPANQIYTINPNAANVEAAADEYKEKLVRMFGTSCLLPETPPMFDLILLGMGPDGHTASLFPGHALLTETSKIMAHIDASPKPPPQRITFTYRTINAATKTFFVCTGAGKAPNLKKVLTSNPTDEDALPSARVTGQITWFVDDAASADYTASL